MIDSIEMEAQSLFVGWTRHFREQDLTLTKERVEVAKTLFLPDPNVLLVGIIDCEDKECFEEYKTANPRSAKTWKREWLLSTQALTYGLLTGGEKPFLVRKAFKSRIPEYDHAWFHFDPRDLDMWTRQIGLMASEIRALQLSGIGSPWPLNIEHGCFAYGPNYPCPYWAEGCSKHNFEQVPENTPFSEFPEFKGENRAILEAAMKEHPNALVLSKTRMNTWQRCREFYRKSVLYSFPFNSQAAQLGSRFHDLVAQYNQRLIDARLAKV